MSLNFKIINNTNLVKKIKSYFYKFKHRHIEKKYHVLKGRSNLSKEKVADSAMQTANKLWTVFVMSIVTVPFALVIKLLINNSNEQTINTIFTAYALSLVLVYLIGIPLAIYFRNMALDIYDYLDKQ